MQTMKRYRTGMTLAALTAGAVLLGGCHIDMWRQNKIHKPQQESTFFPDGQSARPLVQGVVVHRADGAIRTGSPFFTGLENRRLVRTIPAQALDAFRGQGRPVGSYPGSGDAEAPASDAEARRAMLLRGEERFNIYCAPCHGRAGDGEGMIAVRGLGQRRTPANYHTARLRATPDGHLYDVITNGFGVMYSYASRINEPADRWAIVAYIRALQRAQNARPGDVPGGDPRAAEATRTSPAAGAHEGEGEH